MSRQLPNTPWGSLPPGMRLLFISAPQDQTGWLQRAFQADRASDVIVQEVSHVTEALGLLRHRVFDAVLIAHTTNRFNALESLDAVRTGSSAEQPVLILGDAPEKDMAPLCYEAGADAYICMSSVSTRGLLWEIARAIERDQLLAENRQLRTSNQNQLQLEQNEAQILLAEQMAVLASIIASTGELPGADQIDPSANLAEAQISEQNVQHYRELLRTYVVMGSGNLEAEIETLTMTLSQAQVTLTTAMQLHVHVMEETIQQLGSRSARHVMNRGNLLAMEVLVKLGESYRRSDETAWAA